jgi:hypothetical protein
MRGRSERRLHVVLGTGPLGLAVARYLADTDPTTPSDRLTAHSIAQVKHSVALNRHVRILQ